MAGSGSIGGVMRLGGEGEEVWNGVCGRFTHQKMSCVFS